MFFDRYLHGKVEMSCYLFIDLQGREVARGRTADNQIDLSGLEAGVYALRLHDLKGGTINLKVVKE